MKPVGNRIRYIDAMRGTTMLMVVYGHVMFYGLGTSDVISRFFASFRMPTFFFISGYIAYKAVEKWNATFFRARLKKKAMVQIIPTVVFFVAYSLVNLRSPIDDYAADGFGFFWFTIALFEMFCIYFTLSRLGNITRPWVTYLGLIAFAIAGIIYTYCFEWDKPDYYQLRHTADFFQFFVLGIFCRMGGQHFHDFIDRKPVRWGIIALFAAMAAAAALSNFRGEDNSTFQAIWHSEFMNVARGYVGVFAVYTIFRSTATFFDRTTTVPNLFSFIGRRTLDIYLLHYFFLPDLSTTLAPWLQAHGNTLITFVVSVAIAIVITALCLLTSRIIRLSPFLARHLFGANPNNP